MQGMLQGAVALGEWAAPPRIRLTRRPPIRLGKSPETEMQDRIQFLRRIPTPNTDSSLHSRPRNHPPKA